MFSKRIISVSLCLLCVRVVREAVCVVESTHNFKCFVSFSSSVFDSIAVHHFGISRVGIYVWQYSTPTIVICGPTICFHRFHTTHAISTHDAGHLIVMHSNRTDNALHDFDPFLSFLFAFFFSKLIVCVPQSSVENKNSTNKQAEAIHKLKLNWAATVSRDLCSLCFWT